jgi:hypothetical protein
VAECEPTAKEYRATIADSYGHADVLRGWTDGDLLTFQSMVQARVRIRLLWHLADAERMTWRNESPSAVHPSPWSNATNARSFEIVPGDRGDSSTVVLDGTVGSWPGFRGQLGPLAGERRTGLSLASRGGGTFDSGPAKRPSETVGAHRLRR